MNNKLKKSIVTVLTTAMALTATTPAFASGMDTTMFPLQQNVNYQSALNNDALAEVVSKHGNNSSVAVPYLNIYEDSDIRTINILQKGEKVATGKLEIDYRYGVRKLWIDDARASLTLQSNLEGTVQVCEADDNPSIVKISDNEYIVTADYRLEILYPNGTYEISTPTISARLFANSDDVVITWNVAGLV